MERPVFKPTPLSNTLDAILRSQLNWMLLFRVLLYTSLLAFSILFQDAKRPVWMPHNQLVLLLLGVYTVTIASAFALLTLRGHFLRFGLLQSLIDTLFASIIIFATGSARSMFTFTYFFAIIAGGLILPRYGGLLAAAASSLMLGVILGLEYFGYISPQARQAGLQPIIDADVLFNHFSLTGLSFFLAAFLAALLGARISKTETALAVSLTSFDRLTFLYKRIFDTISTGIITTDDEHHIISANNAAAAISGATPASMVGKAVAACFPGLDLSARGVRQVANFTRADGDSLRIGYSVISFPHHIRPDGPARDGSIITLKDISDIEKMENQMRQHEKLAAIGMMSAGIAHDFRNPLAAISGSAQILADETAKRDGRDSLNFELTSIIIREATRMIDTIADFLKFSRPDTVEAAWFSLRGCVLEVEQVCRANPKWPETARLEIDVPPGLDAWADRNQIHALLGHFITNAMAFCPQGAEFIRVSAREIHQNGREDMLRIEVGDNGPGIPESERERIFEPFYTTRADGTGLGLAIVRQIVETHHGNLRVGQSELGGAALILTLPFQDTNATEPPATIPIQADRPAPGTK
jgi:two-component system sensor histidine kinase PilS (NtrC family)